jgi:hypothetical protein
MNHTFFDPIPNNSIQIVRKGPVLHVQVGRNFACECFVWDRQDELEMSLLNRMDIPVNVVLEVLEKCDQEVKEWTREFRVQSAHWLEFDEARDESEAMANRDRHRQQLAHAMARESSDAAWCMTSCIIIAVLSVLLLLLAGLMWGQA